MPSIAEDVVKPGQAVEAKIIKMTPSEQRIGLSLRAHPEIDTKQDVADHQKAQEEKASDAPTIGGMIKEAQAAVEH